jgi:hypothetical protein
VAPKPLSPAEWAAIWQALRDDLNRRIDADAKVFESFAGTPQQAAFGGLLSANRTTLAKMRELERG